MAQSLTHDVLILGAGLAGLRAAVELSHRTEGHIDIGIVSKVQLMRAHSVCAEGGTAAVLREDEGDSIALHAWDSVKGSDFLADQDVVWRFCKAMPREIQLLDHWGIPWTRDAQGRIASARSAGIRTRARRWRPTRPASSRCRRCTTSCCATRCFKRYDELFITDIVVEDGPLRGAGRHPCAERRDGGPAGEGAADRVGRRRHALRFHDVLRDRDGRRHGHGLSRRAAARGHGVPAVPPDRPRAVRDPDDGGLPGRGRLPEEQQGRAVHGALRPEQDGAGAPRHGVPRGDDGDPRGPGVPRPRGQGLPAPRPDAPGRGHHQHAPAAHPRGVHQVRRHRPDREAHPHPAGGALLDGRHRDRHQRPDAGEEHLGGGRGGLRVAARRQPPGLELDGRVPRVGRHQRRGDRARAALAAEADAPLGAELAGAAGAAEGDHGPPGQARTCTSCGASCAR